jgi:phage terminase large subunit
MSLNLLKIQNDCLLDLRGTETVVKQFDPVEVGFTYSNVFWRNYNSARRIKCNEGGARSTKTYSILQILINNAIAGRVPEVTTIIRKTFNSVKGTVMRDFFDLLNSIDLYERRNHNKTDHIYRLNNTIFEFQGLDQPTRKRGAKRNKLFINEANEIDLEDWTQLSIRTIDDIFLDYNPSHEFHFIYDKIVPRPDCELIKSTYKDNPFLQQNIVTEIERLRTDSPSNWRIYGEGLRGVSEEVIYKNYEIVDTIPPNYKEIIYGFDFGFVKPSALVRIYIYDDCILIEELLYETRLTNQQLIQRVDDLEIDRNDYLYADCAEPARISEFADAGYNIFESDKSVLDGIDYVQRQHIKILSSSLNIIKEIRSYSNKVDRQGNILEDPVKFNDHSMDAIRYGLYTHSKKTGDIAIFI